MKALLVEDNATDVTLFRVALETISSSIDLSVADDGEKALEYLHQEGVYVGAARPDFILLDLNLPRKDGFEVLGELKGDPDLCLIPVIVLTSSRNPEEVARAYDLQAAAYFVKPLSGYDRIVHSIVKFMDPEGLQDLPLESSGDVPILVDAAGSILMANGERASGWIPVSGSVSAGAALDQALDNLRPIIRESGAEIVRGEMPTVTADHALLVQLFEILVGNALKFCGGGRTWIEITARRSETDWVFCVRDNGNSVDLKYFDRILHLFRHLHVRESYPGAGNGLDVCERIVERLGGRIWAETSPGASAAFFFTVPDDPGASPSQVPEPDGAA
jgi:CheY-like chemotaxis protein